MGRRPAGTVRPLSRRSRRTSTSARSLIPNRTFATPYVSTPFLSHARSIYGRLYQRVSGRLVRFCTLTPGATVVKPVGSATGNGEGSRRRIRTRIAVQNPVAQVIVAILRGRGTFATPRQGGDDAHWVCRGLHPRPDAATPARRAHRRLAARSSSARSSPAPARPSRPERSSSRSRARAMSSWCGNSTAFGRSIRDLIDLMW